MSESLYLRPHGSCYRYYFKDHSIILPLDTNLQKSSLYIHSHNTFPVTQSDWNFNQISQETRANLHAMEDHGQDDVRNSPNNSAPASYYQESLTCTWLPKKSIPHMHPMDLFFFSKYSQDPHSPYHPRFPHIAHTLMPKHFGQIQWQ